MGHNQNSLKTIKISYHEAALTVGRNLGAHKLNIMAYIGDRL
jgi:hypothetical protein